MAGSRDMERKIRSIEPKTSDIERETFKNWTFHNYGTREWGLHTGQISWYNAECR